LLMYLLDYVCVTYKPLKIARRNVVFAAPHFKAVYTP
jgi:hypothetical protein